MSGNPRKLSKNEKKVILLEAGKAESVPVYFPGAQNLVAQDGLLVSTEPAPAFDDIASAVKKLVSTGTKKEKGKRRIEIGGKRYWVSSALWAYVRTGARALPNHLEILSYYPSCQDYRRRGLAVVSRTADGKLIYEDVIRKAPKAPTAHGNPQPRKCKAKKAAEAICPDATVEQLAEACREAIADASGFRYHRFAERFRKGADAATDLRNYSFKVCVNGRTSNMRADCVLAMAKRDWSGGTDAYGTRPLGAVVCGKKCKQWRLVYEADAETRKHGEIGRYSNIDHVVPQSEGGKTRLANLQLMKLADNSKKSSEASGTVDDATSDALASAKTMLMFARGFFSHRKAFDKDMRKNVFALVRADLAYSVKAALAS